MKGIIQIIQNWLLARELKKMPFRWWLEANGYKLQPESTHRRSVFSDGKMKVIYS